MSDPRSISLDAWRRNPQSGRSFRAGRKNSRHTLRPLACSKSGVPAAALARSGDLAKSPHLTARGFWDRHGSGVLPALPWQASFGRRTGPAPALGADTDRVLTEVLGLPLERIAALRAGGAFG